MNNRVGSNGTVPEGGVHDAARYYKKDFWGEENLKFSQPWYRLEKSAKIINKLADGRQCTLLDVGCGPAALMQVLPPNIQYYGIDIAIQRPRPNLVEADILETPIRFEGKQFDLVIAHGLFEYVGGFQSQKFSEVAQILKENGKFLLTYTNFGHRKKHVYPAFSNVQPLDDFRRDLERYFNVDRVFPVAHNWKHGHPGRKLTKAANMHINANIPFIGPALAVEYYFICSRQS
jgi:SAM-dependent methyltransferase